ncbi:MAG: PorT family protein [Tannerella sp.]|jgi:hypothetical protein|nr:PorT family protein [Tannerella sp.]
MKKALKYGIIIGLIGLFCCPSSTLRAQEKFPRWEFKIYGGFNIGGTSPLPLPAEIRAIDAFTPILLAPHVSLEAIRRLNRKWGISVQLALDHKGFEVTDRVKSLHTEIEMNNEVYEGNFTGKNTTRIHNAYITLPVAATYRIAERWELQAGAYLAYLQGGNFKGTASDGYIRQGSPTGEKTVVDKAMFDFSEKQRVFDYGLLLAGEWEFYPRFGCRGQIAWGLCPLFPRDFTGVPVSMYNIYGGLGITYRLN